MAAMATLITIPRNPQQFMSEIHNALPIVQQNLEIVLLNPAHPLSESILVACCQKIDEFQRSIFSLQFNSQRSDFIDLCRMKDQVTEELCGCKQALNDIVVARLEVSRVRPDNSDGEFKDAGVLCDRGLSVIPIRCEDPYRNEDNAAKLVEKAEKELSAFMSMFEQVMRISQQSQSDLQAAKLAVELVSAEIAIIDAIEDFTVRITNSQQQIKEASLDLASKEERALSLENVEDITQIRGEIAALEAKIAINQRLIQTTQEQICVKRKELEVMNPDFSGMKFEAILQDRQPRLFAAQARMARAEQAELEVQLQVSFTQERINYLQDRIDFAHSKHSEIEEKESYQ